MKRLIILTVILLSATIASAQEGRNIYNKYSGGEGVTAVYISPSMFKLIGKLPNLEIETESGSSMDLAPLISSFKGFYMLDISNPSVITEINKEVNVMISKGRYDLLMEVKDEGDNVQIYTSGDEKTIESFVFIASDGHEVQFICIDGKINRTDLETLIASAM
ncbi:MAG: DUF4252 domain-containing protein [Bacteroidales bacterium]|nr:DUF4252 domain-containing protein [Bacteroidales bacterium]